MRKHGAITILFFLFLNLSLYCQEQNGERLLTTEAMRADIRFLQSKMENNHPGLYCYSSKAVISKMFDSLENSIAGPLDQTTFYRYITSISSVIRDGHTIILPSAEATDYHNRNSKFLPYHVVIINNRLYIDMVYTADASIPSGSEVRSINHVPADSIIKIMMERQVRDGNNITYPLWILSNYFRQYYSFVFGHSDNFEIEYRINGKPAAARINALSRDSINYYRATFYPGKIFSKQPGQGITLQTIDEKKLAILTIKDFHNDVLKKEFKQHFESTIAGYFKQIKDKQLQNLVLDLRNNQGGDIENGVLLLQYLLDKSFAVVQQYLCVQKNELQPCNGPSMGNHEPSENRFTGKLFVLINGGSFSNSGIVASCLQVNERAVFIGEETGGNPFVINGFTKDIELPNSGIQVQMPTRQFVIKDKNANTGRGLVPDHIIVPTIEDITAGRDIVLQFTFGQIK